MGFTKMKCKAMTVLSLLLLFMMLPSRPAKAQADITGEWSPRVYNDGMDVGDYTGIPINQAGRLRAESWHPDLPDLPENLCRPHPVDIGLRVSVSQLYITKEFDKETGQDVGYHLHVAWQAGEQVIYTDGRPHPSANAPHKWSGFSTGHWEGNTLVYTTDHLKEAYLTRTGVPRSSFSTVTTRIHRYGNYLNIIFIINDPAYLTEPYIREYSWVSMPDQVIPPYPCETSPGRDHRSGGEGAELSARAERFSQRLCGGVRHTARGGVGRRGRDVSRLHQETQDDEGGAAHDDGALQARAVKALATKTHCGEQSRKE